VLDIARRADASYAVVGGAVAIGPRLRLTARVYDLASGRDLGQAVAEGLPDEVLALVDELSVQIVGTLLAGTGGDALEARRAASLSTTSLPALRAYLEGEARYRRSDFPGAIAALEEAIAADSSFALALFRLSDAYGWQVGRAPESERWVRAALRHIHRLSARDALMVRASFAQDQRDPELLDLARTLIQRYPDDPDAWSYLGEFHFHMGEVALTDYEDAARAFERAVELDPSFGPYYIHLIDIALATGDEPRARELIDTFAALAPGTRDLQRFRLRFGLIFGDDAERRRLGAALDTVPDDVLALPYFEPAALAAAEIAGREMHRRNGRPFPLARTLMMRGRVRELARLLGSAESAAPIVTYAALYELPDAPAILQRALQPDGVQPFPNVIAAYDAAQRGDWARFDAARAALRRIAAQHSEAGDSVLAVFAAELGRVLDAYGRVRNGDEGAAIRALHDVRRSLSHEIPPPVDFVARFLLGELLANSSDPRAAVPYLRSVRTVWVPAHYRIGQAYERAGMPDSARTAYSQFLLAWSEADEDLPLLTAARAALARLARE
jgi:tetratricopeptide (TPR) repeat protein